MGSFVSGIYAGLLTAFVFLVGSISVRVLAQIPAPAIAKSRLAVDHAPALAKGATGVGGEAISDYDRLRARQLLLPVDGYDPAKLRDSFLEPRINRAHEAIDLLAPRGTRVLATDDGVIRKLSSGSRGGTSIYQLDSAGGYGYYYAHLDRYAPFLREGQEVRKGDLIGYVGTTGNAPAGTPHLHFAITRVDDPRRWWAGRPVNPFVIWSAPAGS